MRIVVEFFVGFWDLLKRTNWLAVARVFMALLLTIAVLRLAGHRDVIFKDVAHVAVGTALGGSIFDGDNRALPRKPAPQRNARVCSAIILREPPALVNNPINS